MSELVTSFTSAVAMGARAVRRNKLRTALTVLGILIGIAAVLLVIALSRSVRERVSSQVAALGSNAFIVFPKSTRPSGVRTVAGARLSERDAAALAEGGASIRAACGIQRANVQVSRESQTSTPTIIGTRLAYFDIRAWDVVQGERWTASAEATAERVVVIGRRTAENLFGPADPVGQLVRIGRAQFRVVGVLAEKGPSPFGRDQDDIVLMPISTVRARVLGARRDEVNAILFQASSDSTQDRAERQAISILRQRHRLAEADPDDFSIQGQAEFARLEELVFGTLSLVLVSVAAISLLVGGIGVMNIMLVSVAERTREIGIRMAIGARERDILTQFLVEAVLLGLLGGAAGVAIGYGAIVALRAALDWTITVHWDAIALSVGVSVGIGITFGFLPARRAARLNPVQALGRE